MISSINSKPCILCDENLELKTSGNSLKFFCNSCGYESKTFVGYTLSRAYNEISNEISPSNKTKETTQKFPSKMRRKSVNFQSESLEEDQLIGTNIIKAKNQKNDLNYIPEVIDDIFSDGSYQTVYFSKFDQSLPKVGKHNIELPSFITNNLKAKGIDSLYQYQEDAFKLISNGKNVVITAPTGLGKTEAFLLPILTQISDLIDSDGSRMYALLIYPTKALAEDQFNKIKYYCKNSNISIAKYDGDTSKIDRRKLYDKPPNLIITNPDMIHYHLMNNISFQSLIKSIKYIVLDEIHLCTGAFGTNILWIIRRLRRFSSGFICIGASATISNAKIFSETIFSDKVKIVTPGTARKSDLFLTMIYPRERSNLSTMSKVTGHFIKNAHQTLAFGNGHLAAESLNLILRNQGFKSQIHRAGLPYEHRRKVENDFKSNLIDVLVSTPTLELGIDIGELDSVVSMLTSLTSFVQRIGRAGRQGQNSFATLVLRGDDPISAYYARNPDEYISDIDPAFVEPNNSLVRFNQIIAMIIDKPMSYKEGKEYEDILEQLINQDLVILRKEEYKPKMKGTLQKLIQNYSIRGMGRSVSILQNDRIIGERGLPKALSELHTGAIYLHGGKSFKVQKYNPAFKTSKVSLIPNHYERTQAMRSIWPEIESLDYEASINGISASYLTLNLTETVNGYVKKDIFTNRVIDTYSLSEPISYQFTTKGFILAMPKPDAILSNMDPNLIEYYLGGTYHAIEHVLIESANSITGGGASQIGGISMGVSGLIFVYDGTEGGSGLSKLLFDSLVKGFNRSIKILKDCPCKREDGCPRCTYSYQCGNNNAPLNRIGAIDVLELVGKYSTELNLDYQDMQPYVINPD